MSTKDWKNKEIGQLLSEAWGFKFNSLEEFNEFNGEGELQAEAEHDDELDEGRGKKKKKMEEADEDLDEGRGKKKKMEEADEDLDEGSMTPHKASARRTPRGVGSADARRSGEADERDDEPKKMKEEDELEEGGAAQRRGDPRVRRQDPDRLREEEELEEKLGDGKTQGTDSKDAGLDDNPEFTGKDFAAEKGGERGKKGKKPTKEQIEALVKKALQEALQKRKG